MANDDWFREIDDESEIDDLECVAFDVDRPEFFFEETDPFITPEMRNEIDAAFPVEHYGKDILVFEGWSLRNLLLQALAIGAWIERNKDKIAKKNEDDASKHLESLEDE